MRKKLIEVALPLEAINKASAREKSIRHGHPSTLHLWWARRPLAACRAVIFTSLVDDPDDPEAPADFVEACKALPKGKNATANDTPRQRLFDFIERLVLWESTTDEEVLETARELIRISTDGNPPPLLDPFAGGGSIPLEAQRLGLEAHASDLNPVAVMINKGLIEIPPKFADMPPVNPRDRAKVGGRSEWKGAAGLAADVRYYGEWMRDRAWERIGHLYPKHNGEIVIAWLWARTVKCPNPACSAQMPLVRSFDLSKKKGKRVWVEPLVNDDTREITFNLRKANLGDSHPGTVDRQGATCLACHTPVAFDYIRSEGVKGRISAQLMSIVTEGQNKRNYYAPTTEQSRIADVPIPDVIPNTDLPEQALGFRVQRYGMIKHVDLFTPRQLVSLTTFGELIIELHNQIHEDLTNADELNEVNHGGEAFVNPRPYSNALALYLSFAVNKGANLWSSLSSWMNDRGALRETFARQSLSMIWDYAEANPFSNSGGSFLKFIDKISRALEYSPASIPAFIGQRDAAKSIDVRNAIVVTDPPYYDNIGYADLSDYFYIWMRKSLQDIYKTEFSTVLVPKTHELISNPYRFGGDRRAANLFFESGLKSVFAKLNMSTSPHLPISVFYAFKQSELGSDPDEISSTGWEIMLQSLIQAGFTIAGTWPIRTESAGRIRNIGANALASSIVLVCRRRPIDMPWTSRRQFIQELRQELPIALKEMQSGNIAPVDLAQASIGPGMAVYSKYSKVLEPNGDPVSVRTALQLINQELDTYLSEQEGHLDSDSRFAVAWFEQFGFNEAGFGQADVLARAKDTSVEGMVNAGVLVSGAGKVRLLKWDELDPGWDPATDKRLTVWEAAHHLIERLNTHGEEGAAILLAKMSPDLAADARQLAYRLYSICERKGWAKEARDYNALVVSWSTSQEQAATFKEQYQQGALFDHGR